MPACCEKLHADAAAVMQRNPCCARSRIEKRVQERPVGHGIRTILHGLCFAVGRGDRAAIEMVATDDDRGFHRRCETISLKARPRRWRSPRPTQQMRAGRAPSWAIRSFAISSQLQVLVVGQQLLHLGVCLGDIFRIAGQRHAQRQPGRCRGRTAGGYRAGTEAGEGKGVFKLLSSSAIWRILLPQSTVGNSGIPEIGAWPEPAPSWRRAPPFQPPRVIFPLGAPFRDGPAKRQVAMHRIMRRGLVGDDIRLSTPRLDEFRRISQPHCR